MKIRKLLSLILAIIMIAAVVCACKTADVADENPGAQINSTSSERKNVVVRNNRTLDFRPDELVAPTPEGVDTSLDYPGGLRDETYDVAAEIGYETLTGVKYPAEGGRLSTEDVYALYEAAERINAEYYRVVLSNKVGLTLADDIEETDPEAILARIRSAGYAELGDIYRVLHHRDYAVGYIFWQLVNIYLPDGAADLLVYNCQISNQMEWAILDLAGSGYSDRFEAREALSGDRGRYPFATLEFSEQGQVWLNDGNGGRVEIFNAERREFIALISNRKLDIQRENGRIRD